MKVKHRYFFNECVSSTICLQTYTEGSSFYSRAKQTRAYLAFWAVRKPPVRPHHFGVTVSDRMWRMMSSIILVLMLKLHMQGNFTLFTLLRICVTRLFNIFRTYQRILELPRSDFCHDIWDFLIILLNCTILDSAAHMLRDFWTHRGSCCIWCCLFVYNIMKQVTSKLTLWAWDQRWF